MPPCPVKAGHRDVFPAGENGCCRNPDQFKGLGLVRWTARVVRPQEMVDCSSASSAEAGISIHAAVSVQSSAQRTGRPG